MSKTKPNTAKRSASQDKRAARREAERAQMGEAIEALRSSEGWQRWLRARRHFHTYSFHNQLLIAHQCPHASRVAGFTRWLAIGYRVRRGERGVRIWAPCPPSKKRLREWREAGADRRRRRAPTSAWSPSSTAPRSSRSPTSPVSR